MHWLILPEPFRLHFKISLQMFSLCIAVFQKKNKTGCSCKVTPCTGSGLCVSHIIASTLFEGTRCWHRAELPSRRPRAGLQDPDCQEGAAPTAGLARRQHKAEGRGRAALASLCLSWITQGKETFWTEAGDATAWHHLGLHTVSAPSSCIGRSLMTCQDKVTAEGVRRKKAD